VQRHKYFDLLGRSAWCLLASVAGIAGHQYDAVFAGFGIQISLGVFGTDFGSDIMTISLQLSKSERKVSCF
jgi:hypothetical protein